jgi:deoxyribodipyrimidine photo-lyase
MSSSTPNKKIGLHWFRRDLRVVGNPALQWNWKQHDGQTLGIFVFDQKFLSRPDFSHNRFGFFLKSIADLKMRLRDIGSDLLVIDDQPAAGLSKVISALKAKGFQASVSFNRDYEPFARARDQTVSSLLAGDGIPLHTEADHLLVEPEMGLKDDGTPYKVYSPFWRKWYQILQQPEQLKRIELQRKSLKKAAMTSASEKKSDEKRVTLTWSSLFGGANPFPDSLEGFTSENAKHLTVPLPEAGQEAVLAALNTFAQKIDQYGDHRDFPKLAGTSKFSFYLKNGSVTTAQIIAALNLDEKKLSVNREKFLKELAWREFYYSILYHFPRVESEAFIEKYKNIQWENDEKLFQKWKDGLTGYPIVDAGMRELKQTGWMHNRVRMIVASFLTKDLLIDWRWGEKYFMEKLLDGDLAPNNGGWQWAASTGCDPQPYFRIFNPWLQGQRFDEDCEYIRKYIPELAKVSNKDIHNPAGDRTRYGYPEPIVDHPTQKPKALALFSTT